VTAAWTLFAFAGAYSWTTIPLIAAAIVVATSVRPRLFRREHEILDAGICVCLLAAALQLVPLPAAARMALSPSLATVDRTLRLDASANPAEGPARPLSVDPGAGAEALLIAAAVVLLFWSAREIYAAGGIRRSARALASFGLALSAIALTQHVVRPHLIYGIWRPQSRNAEYPFGPFVNRNDLAAWLVMALPLAVGYFAARVDTRRREGRLNVEALFDRTGGWLALSIGLMAATLVSTLSRSGLIAGLAGGASLVLLTRGRMERRGRAWLFAGLALVAVVAGAYANVGALTTRVGETIESGVGGRREMWQTTAAIVRDFPLSGVGLGAFERAMTVYQPPHLFAFNHAHDEYLQIAAEGGLLLVAPVLVVIAAGAWRVRRLLEEDRTPVYWIRVGAASSLVAIAIQSLWETGLRMPANAVLFALAAAIALHRGERGSGAEG
jgi:O-antigen ligase